MKQKTLLENPYIPKPYKILEFCRESSDTFTLTVAMKIDHKPGQFLQVTLPGIGECPISIGSYSKEYVKLTIREIGNMTNALAKLKKNDTVWLRGPYGNGFPMEKLKGNNLIILGGGCGVAPLRGIIDYVEKNRSDYKDVLIFIGYRSPTDILFSKEVESWRKKFNLQVTVDKNADNEFCHDAKTGFVTEALKATSMDNKDKVVFMCGPPLMMSLAIEILNKKGFHDDQLFVSAERLMYCGLGICCHCMIHGKFTCIDGPVFRYDEIKEYKND